MEPLLRRRPFGALILALALSWPASAAVMRAPVLPRAGSLGVLAVPAIAPGLSTPNLQAGRLSLAPQLAPSLLPLTAAAPIPSLAPAAVPRVSAVGSAAAAPVSLTESLQQGLLQVGKAQTADRSGLAGSAALSRVFDGQGKSDGLRSLDDAVLVNDEGVGVFGKAAAYYKEIRRTVEALKGRVDMSESLDVMDDAYGDVWAKLKAVEAVSRSRQLSQQNTHLEESLTWVDGVMRDQGRTVAIHTHRVFFHRSPNPQSEIAEGTRRVDKYLDDTLKQFSRNGRAEKAMGRFDEVVLAFDTRGYQELKDHLKGREAEVTKASQGRYRFVYLDELAQAPATPEAMHQELNALTERYRGRGLDKIIEGVIYSRYVGLLLELKTLEHFLDQGYEVLQSGRELFDADKRYITELDAVVRGPDGKVSVVEAKSARVQLPPEDVLRDKVIAKLDCYAKYRALLESDIGTKFDQVMFSFDVGGQPQLEAFLTGQESSLSKKYGFPVKFVFLQTGPARGAPGKHKKR